LLCLESGSYVVELAKGEIVAVAVVGVTADVGYGGSGGTVAVVRWWLL